MTAVSVVIPVYFNEPSLRELCRRLDAALIGRYPDYEVILVDDGSHDASWSVIRELGAASPRIRGIRLSRNYGQQYAITAGLEAAQGERVVLMDADLEDRPESLPPLLDQLVDPVDIVYTAFRTAGGESQFKLTSYLYHLAFSRITKASMPRNLGTLRAFNHKVLKAMLRFGEANIIYGPLMFLMGFNATFVEVTRDVRKEGRSSYNFFRRLKLASATLASYTNLPITVLFGLGSLVFVATVIYILAILVQYVIFGVSLPPGLTLLTLLILLMFGMMLVGFGIIGTYVFRVYQEVLGRPRYLTMDVVNSRSA